MKAIDLFRGVLWGLVLTAFWGASSVWAEPTFDERGVHRQRVEAGKVNRVYSLYVSELDWEAMKKFARTKEWDGEGTYTMVCFFDDWRNTPDVTFTGQNFSDSYKDNWVAGYWRHANGNEIFVKYPARRREMNFY